MTKYTDTDALVEYLDKQFKLIMGSEGYYSRYAQGYDMAMIDVDKFPAADVVEVVRCKDCVNFLERVDSYGVLQSFCMRPIKSEDYSGTGYLIPLEVPVKEYDFCSYRKKRDKKEQ